VLQLWQTLRHTPILQHLCIHDLYIIYSCDPFWWMDGMKGTRGFHPCPGNHLQNSTATCGIFSMIKSNISSVMSSIWSELVCSSSHFNSFSSSSRLPSYIVGMPFSKYISLGTLLMPYSTASSGLSIFTKVMPNASHSSSMFSSSSSTFCDFLSLLSSGKQLMDQNAPTLRIQCIYVFF